MANDTAAHYSKQWGDDTGYTKFIRNAPEAAKFTMARQLGWPDLFARVRAQASERETAVYDAACGFGLIFSDLFADPKPAHLHYLGADIHNALGSIHNPYKEAAEFVQWDISKPVDRKFDYVICRAAIHHTPDPLATFKSLIAALKKGGTIAISAYTKKAPMREAVDTALRSEIVKMTPDEGLAVAKQFSVLGRDLQSTDGVIVISEDLPFLGIKAGRYPIQEFIYDHFIKCWYNPEFTDKSDIVNFDWYHPPYAYRYAFDELEQWFHDAGIRITHAESNKAQHYLEGVLDS